MGDRCPEHRHERIADDLVDPAPELAPRPRPIAPHAAVDHRADLLGIGSLGQGREAGQVGERRRCPPRSSSGSARDRPGDAGSAWAPQAPQNLKSLGVLLAARRDKLAAARYRSCRRTAGPNRSALRRRDILLSPTRSRLRQPWRRRRSRSRQVRTASKTPARISPQDRPTARSEWRLRPHVWLRLGVLLAPGTRS